MKKTSGKQSTSSQTKAAAQVQKPNGVKHTLSIPASGAKPFAKQVEK